MRPLSPISHNKNSTGVLGGRQVSPLDQPARKGGHVYHSYSPESRKTLFLSKQHPTCTCGGVAVPTGVDAVLVLMRMLVLARVLLVLVMALTLVLVLAGAVFDAGFRLSASNLTLRLESASVRCVQDLTLKFRLSFVVKFHVEKGSSILSDLVLSYGVGIIVMPYSRLLATLGTAAFPSPTALAVAASGTFNQCKPLNYCQWYRQDDIISNNRCAPSASHKTFHVSRGLAFQFCRWRLWGACHAGLLYGFMA